LTMNKEGIVSENDIEQDEKLTLFEGKAVTGTREENILMV